MKIMHVIPTLGFGGAEIMLENLSKQLHDDGHTVIVLSLSGERTEIAKRIESHGIQVIYMNKKKGFSPSFIFRLLRLFQKEKPDVVHTHLHCTIYAFPAACLAKVPAKIHTLHSIATKENGSLHRKINKLFFRFFGVVPVALSKNVQKTIIQEYGLKPCDIPIVFNGIDLERCIPKTSIDLHEVIQIIHVGRFSKEKNHINLIKAFQLIHDAFPKSNLLLLGDGALRNEVENEIKQCGLDDCVLLVGQTSEVFRYLNEADIFVLPSVYEGIPITVIEAMATSIPIVVSPVGGVPEMVSNGIEAVYCDTNPESIFHSVKSIIENEDLRKTIAKGAFRTARRFSVKAMTEHYSALYETFLRKNKY